MEIAYCKCKEGRKGRIKSLDVGAFVVFVYPSGENRLRVEEDDGVLRVLPCEPLTVDENPRLKSP